MTSSTIPRGYLIVIEGLDRSGKTTQCQLLQDALKQQGHKVRYVKFPDRTTPTGKMINSYLTGQAQQDDHAIHLIFSANRWEAAKSIKEDIGQGITIIIDRYSYSGAVYSAAKDNPELSLEWAWFPEIGLPLPDITIFLDISSADASKRGGYGEERYETEKMQSRVRTLFNDLFSRIDGLNLRTVDAGQSLAEVGSDVLSHVASIRETKQLSGSLGKLEQLRPHGSSGEAVAASPKLQSPLT